MKETRMYVAAFISLFLIIPLAATQIIPTVHSKERRNAVSAAAPSSRPAEAAEETFRVFRTSTGKVADIGAVDYICGVVAAEVPAEYHEEALKAQAVAAFTYACHAREKNLADPTKNRSIGGADLSDSASTAEAYLPEDSARVKWGRDFDAQWSRIRRAVEQVAGQVIVWQGKPIDAVYFSCSAGRTETSADVWNDDVPYLKSVDSSFDRKAPDYASRRQIAQADAAARIKAGYPKADLGAKPEKWLGSVVRSAAGGIKTADLGGVKVSGEDLRVLFGLRSANFSVAYQKGSFVFNVRGDGHGVGMSQYGAEYLAAHGKTWKQILSYYYTGVSIAAYKWQMPAAGGS